MAQADIGVSIGSGTDIALETAQVVLMKSDLCDVLTAIDLSQATLTRIRRNFAWACIYNILSIPIAAGVFYPIVHRGLPPIVAAMCMGLSSISVIASSLLLKRYKKPILVDDDGGLLVPPASPPTTDFTFPGGYVLQIPESVMRWVRRARGYAFSSLATEDASVAGSPLSQAEEEGADSHGGPHHPLREEADATIVPPIAHPVGPRVLPAHAATAATGSSASKKHKKAAVRLPPVQPRPADGDRDSASPPALAYSQL